MLPTVRNKIKSRTPKLLEGWGVNWTTIQKIDIKEKHGFPCQWKTLYNIVKKESHPTLRIEKGILDYFKEQYNVNNNIVTLVDTSEYGNK